jgi:hypothetical protein
MYLVRRKVDGKWWRNLSYHSKYGKELWADSPQGIKPFNTRGGCKNAMGSMCYDRVADPRPNGDVYTRWVKNPHKFDQQFEIVPVKITVCLASSG